MERFDFDAFKDKAKDLAQSGVSKSKQIAEVVKLNLNNMSEEDAIKKAYVELGKLYYAEHVTDPAPAYAAYCEKITAAKVTIEENKSRIEELKKSGGISDAEITVVETATAPEPEKAEDSAKAPDTPVEPLADNSAKD